MDSSNHQRRHLSDCLHATAQRFADNEALVFAEQRLTWEEVDRRVDRLAGALLALGVQRGERIGIVCSNRPEYILTYLAAARVGAILAGFNIQHTLREIADLAAIVQPSVIVALGDFVIAEQLAPVVATMPCVRHAIAIGEPIPEGWLDFYRLLEHGAVGQEDALRERTATLTEEDGALIVFTGGTTGTPKAALLSHKNIVANIDAQNRHLGWRADDRVLLHLPLNHVSGATLLVAGAVLSGAALILLERFHAEHALAAVARESVTLLGQVPTMWLMEFLLPGFSDYDLSSVRMAIVSGAPTPDQVMRQIAVVAPVAIHAYGLTEVAGMVTYNRLGDGLDVLLRAAGRAAPEFELRIVDKQRQTLPPGAAGEIAIRGECAMQGYFAHPEESALVIDEQGWLYTGDLGKLDAEGYLTVVGRSKDMYISGGYNVYPAEVEAYLDQHPAVAQSACIGVPDDIMGEAGMVFLAPRPGAALNARQVREYCKQGLARYKNPRYVHILESLPLTAVGKIDKRALRQEFGRF